ncbi:hypothetical protein Pst134EA_002863 [Puccinia striiformis f. sp. tritici]|uniref:hypothetical protein n=4 Tax=Puccinia striiformis f. sp. tritici TaxID=168172 RepID=UPI002008B65B|nr:hypothetical protein Pst134EA_002863 [Puccinia striiformis f. sp. tritici]KAH9472243.1 hypothetical protein Pst134EA_002863 [Puccinia striiformis f. sp. tritici]
MSHHKKPIKAGVPKAHLYISDGFLSDNTTPLPAKDEPARTPSRQILHHPFTSQINLLLSNAETPSGKSSPEPVGTQDLVQLLTGMGAYQHFTELNLADLLTEEFAQKYLRSGSLVAMSESKVIGDDLFAIDGYGTIHMRLCQSTYQTLGLSGRRSKFGPPGQHFVVEIDARDQAMRSGKAVHERAKKCLHNFPGSIFNELIGPKHESRGRRWDVVMAWVDEQGSLQPIDASLLPTTTTVTARFPKISQSEKIVHHFTRPDTVDSYLDLYDSIGEAIVSTSENHPRPKGGVLACSIEATGFFHPIKLAELTQTLIKTYRIVSITAHTARTAPFSFLTSRQTSHLRSTNENIPPIKKQKKVKKGKSAMLGPERGIDAGPSSWTFVALEEEAEDASIFPSDRSSGPDPLASSSKGLASSELPLESSADVVVRKRPRSDNLASSASTSTLKRPWIIFESVGDLDTHC